jgi:hypothetical protein
MARRWPGGLVRLPLGAILVLVAASATGTVAAPSSPNDATPAAQSLTDVVGPAFGTHLGLPHESSHRAWASELGMEWIKVYTTPGDWPFQMMLRVPANWQDFDDLDAYCAEVESYVSPYVDAYEIGNEPNLDWTWSEGAPGLENPNPYEYTAVLKRANECIKAVQPEALVIASGMATTGPFSPDLQHPAYPTVWNDLLFIDAMYDAGAKGHFDALGSHPHGFAYSPAEAPSEANSGLVFRRAEQQRAIMEAHGDEETPIWATEWGWLLEEPACQDEWVQEGRWWQVVPAELQASYVRGALEYATLYWPWMDVMFQFNLDFSTVPWYAPCEPMRYYAITNPDGSPRLAYLALRDMPRWPYATLSPNTITLMLDADEMADSYTRSIQVSLVGTDPLTYSFVDDAEWLEVPAGNQSGPGAHPVTIHTGSFVSGTTYQATATVTVNTPVGPVERYLAVRVYVVDEVAHLYLPLARRAPGAAPPTPTPTPTPPPPPPGCSELIANGGFEATSDWEIPGTAKMATYSTAVVHSGSRSMRAGIVPPEGPLHSYSSFRQAVTLPANATSATLRFWLYPISTGTAAAGEPAPAAPLTVQGATQMGDAQYLLVLDQYGSWIGTLFWERSGDGAWRLPPGEEFDLLLYAGQTITLHFGVYNNGYGGVTAMYVDDVSLEVCTP